jgi:hypothetical protein
MFFDIERVPDWAHNWCYYFAGMGIVAILTGFVGLFASKKLGMGLTIIYLIAALTQSATALTLFWMCRSSLGSLGSLGSL